MINRPDTRSQRIKRHKRVRAKVSGTPERPRLNVFRSEKNIYAQIIDDVAGNTLVAASSLDKAIEGNGSNKAAARAAAVTCITAALQSWLKAPARAAWNSKGGGKYNA